MRGSSGLAEHLSFLVTLLAGHTAAQAGRESLALSSSKSRITSISASGNQRAAFVRGRIALTGVVCSSLIQLGDCNLVLNLLAPSLLSELVRYPSFCSVNSFLFAVAVLSTDKRSDSSVLPEGLQEILPKCVAEFLISIFKCDSPAGGVEHSIVLHRPCFVLSSRSQDFTIAVLKSVESILREDVAISKDWIIGLKHMFHLDERYFPEPENFNPYRFEAWR